MTDDNGGRQVWPPIPEMCIHCRETKCRCAEEIKIDMRPGAVNYDPKYMPSRLETCGSCRFYFGGHCRRYPPVFATRIEKGRAYFDQSVSSEFPRVKDVDWCGEYEEENNGWPW